VQASVLRLDPAAAALCFGPTAPLEGLRDVSTRWIVTHELAEWKDEIAWMSLYFSAAVWASLALCVCYSLENHLPRYRTEATIASVPSEVPPIMARHGIQVRAPGGLRPIGPRYAGYSAA